MSPLFTLLETQTLPAFPEAADPGIWPLALMALGTLLITVISIGLALGKRWMSQDPADSTPAALPSGVEAESLPSQATIDADRELAHAAAAEAEPRGDLLPPHRGKTDALGVDL